MSRQVWIDTAREFPGDPRRTEPAGGRRSGDRDGGQGLDTPKRSPAATGTRKRHGCGNGAPMEITNRFPRVLGNLAENARFPHFHKPPVLVYYERQNRRTNQQTLKTVTHLSTEPDQAHITATS